MDFGFPNNIHIALFLLALFQEAERPLPKAAVLPQAKATGSLREAKKEENMAANGGTRRRTATIDEMQLIDV